MKTAFEKMAEIFINDAFEKIKADALGTTHISELDSDKLKHTFYILECIKDHTRFIDAGIGGKQIEMYIGDIVRTQDISIHNLNIDNFKIIKIEKDFY